MAKKATSKMYYKVLGKMSKIAIQKDTGDFRLLDKRCVNAICQMREQSRCTKSLFDLIGYNKKEILFQREKRIAGKTKWNYPKLIQLAIDGITSISTAPLRWMSYISIILFLISILYGIILSVCITIGVNVEQLHFILLGIIFLGSIQMIWMSIIGEYVGRMFQETKNRPAYFIDEINNKKENNQSKENVDEQEKNNPNDINDYHYFTN